MGMGCTRGPAAPGRFRRVSHTSGVSTGSRADDHDVTFRTALSYWTALDHLLRYQLGWTHPAQGSRGGATRARTTGVPLSLMRHVWLGDRFLDWYMAWRVDKCGDRDHVPSAWTNRLTAIARDHDPQPDDRSVPGTSTLRSSACTCFFPEDAE
jgi:hypothetical protein